jgi:endonuclease/exonuclease/phosphatase family metal-dependent hydrolase
MPDLAPDSGPTFPAAAPDRRIDGVFGTAGLVVRGYEVVAAPGVERASDHRPVLVTVGVPSD